MWSQQKSRQRFRKHPSTLFVFGDTTSKKYAEPDSGSRALSPSPISLLELFHPDGVARRALVRGGNCPEILRPLFSSEATEVADLVLFAPTAAECRAVEWLEDTVRELKQRLAPDGIVYVVAPPLRLSLIHI